jgi:hypothetical protein
MHSARSVVALLFAVGLFGCGLSEKEPPLRGGDGEGAVGPPRAIADYRMGDEFGKTPVTAASLTTGTSAFRRAARATARIDGGTGFYLGKFAGAHVMATNHHVLSTMSGVGRTATFPLLDDVQLPCKRLFGTWPTIDLTLVEVTMDAATEAKLTEVAANFTFYDEVKTGQSLITIGFGVAGNTDGVMMANQDADCRVLSKDGEYRRMADPDPIHHGPFEAWSFSHACDVSYGDSGSAMVDRKTGLPVGILWTGRFPKQARVQSSAYLQELLGTDQADVWTEMNYAVPATKIRELIESEVAATSPADETRAVLQALIGGPPSP